MHSSRMRTARLHIVRGGGGRGVLWPGPMSMSGGRERGVVTRSHVHVRGGGGGGEGGVVTRSHVHVRGGGGGREGGVVTRSHVHVRGGREGGVVTMSLVHSSLPPPFGDRMTNTCENITFARFATRAVKTYEPHKCEEIIVSFCNQR